MDLPLAEAEELVRPTSSKTLTLIPASSPRTLKIALTDDSSHCSLGNLPTNLVGIFYNQPIDLAPTFFKKACP